MDEVIFRMYLKWKGENLANFLNNVKKIPKRFLFSFFAIFICLIIGCIFNFIYPQSRAIINISFLILLIVMILLSLSANKYLIRKSEDKFNELEQRYNRLYEWLLSVKFGEKNQIKQLKNQLEKRLNKYKQKCNGEKENINRWFQVLIIPILLSIISYTLNSSVNTEEKLSTLISFTVIVLVIYFAIYIQVRLFNLIESMSINQMSDFIEELQGLLDRKFTIEDNDLI